MSEAVAVLHGAFGRVCLYSMDRTMVSHAHREGHLLFHIHGSPGEVVVDGCPVPLGPGAAVAVNPWQAHYYCQPVPGSHTLLLVLYIRPTWFSRAFGGRMFGLRFGSASIAVSNALARLIDVSAVLDREQDDPAINDWLLSVTAHCFEQSWCGRDADRRFAGVHDFRLRKAVQLLEERVCEPVDLDRVAREAGLSRPHFYKLFRQQVGVTPNIYLNSLRMERAIERLTATTEAVASIGLDLGFSSQASFTRFFIANGVVPPSTYRRSARLACPQ
ncbi:MAG: AraC family transcriptional regulator [Hyphomicrobiaceae bacterium]|nr:AraC family transcriptional regulator [Hyphomicrobiaceae bacterium]